MSTKDFFNLPLGVNFTASDLYNITDALFVASDYYREKKLKGTAGEYEILRKKISVFLKENVDLHY